MGERTEDWEEQPCADERTPLIRHDGSSTHGSHRSVTDYNAIYETRPSSSFENDGLDRLDLVKVPSTSTGIDIEAGLERVTSAATAPGNERISNPEHGDSSGAASSRYADRFINTTPERFRLIFGGIQLGYMIGFFDSTLMASSHPVITSHFHASNSASWLSTAFLLTSTALLPLFGRISDTFGRKPVYIFSIVVFFLTTAWCALAQSIGSFIAARAVCGLGAGGVFSMGMIICSDLVRIEYRGVYQSYINLSLGVGGCLGLAGGGFICDQLGWRGAFAIQLPFIFVYLLVALWTTPSDLGLTARQSGRMNVCQLIGKIDLIGSVILTVAVTALIIGINLGGNVLSWGHPLVISSLVLACVLACIFPWYERDVERPVMPVELLSKRPHANIIFGNFFGAMSVNTILFNVPLFFQAVRLESPTESGIRLVAATIAITCSSVSTGFLITWSKRLMPTIIIGAVLFVLGGCSTTAMALFDIPDGWSMILLSLSSLGQGFAFPSMTVAILAINKQEEQAVATTTLGLWRNLGSVMGVAISSWILQNTLLFRLEQMVTGPDKQEIISRVRKSVDAIAGLDPIHQGQGEDLFFTLYPSHPSHPSLIICYSHSSICQFSDDDICVRCRLGSYYASFYSSHKAASTWRERQA
jgi:MFS family permease